MVPPTAQTTDEELEAAIDELFEEFFPDGCGPSRTAAAINSGDAHLIIPDMDAN